NKLTSLDLSNNNDKLEKLNLVDNSFSEQELSFLSHLVNLKNLQLGNSNQEKIKNGLYNRFVGSLEILKSLKKLEELNINSTDIESGLEYLLSNLEKISCSSKERPESAVKKIDDSLKKQEEFVLSSDSYKGKTYKRKYSNAQE